MLTSGQPAPEFTLVDIDGNRRTLNNLRQGDCLLIVFLRHLG